MRELVVSDAPAARISAIVKRVVEGKGGVVSQQTHQATRFDNLSVNDDAWSRSGYVGTYQRFQDKEVRVRVRLWAAWPRRLFLFFGIAGFAQAILYFAISVGGGSLSPNVWIFSAILTFLGLGVALLTYATSWAASTDAEEDIALSIGRLASDDPEVPGRVFTLGDWSEHRRDLVEDALAKAPEAAAKPKHERAEETEVPGKPARRASRKLGRLRRARADEEEPATEAVTEEEPKRSRFSLRRRRASPEESEGTEAKPKKRFSLRRRKADEEPDRTEP